MAATPVNTIVLLQDDGTSTPDVSTLTTNSLTGTGVFDILMKVTKLHLQEEYENDRITGEEYSTVYLGALTAVMQQSVAYILNYQQEQKIIAETSLLRQKIVTELVQTDDDIPIGLGFNGGTDVGGLVAGKIALDALQETLAQSQIDQAEAENDLIGQKIITELAQTGASLDRKSVV